MTLKEIRTGDELIHRFMGKEPKEKEELLYLYSWNELMPVIEKIEKLPCPWPKRDEYKYTCHLNIGTNFIDFSFTQKHFTETFHPPVDCKSFMRLYDWPMSDLKTKKEAVWHCIVAFVQWHNNQCEADLHDKCL